MSINRVIISGNLTRDPELRSTSSGTSVLQFGVAVNDRHKNQQTGEWEDYPNFVDCIVFGNRADSLARFISKGSKVAIEGKLRYSQWEKDGQKRSKLEVIVDELEFMSSQQNGQQQAPQPQQAPQYAAPQPAYAPQYQAQQGYAPQQMPVQQQAPYPQAAPTLLYDQDIRF